jgi:membrane protease YdiL (CAAX protease family)
MLNRIKLLSPFAQLFALIMIGGVSFFLLSTVLSLVISTLWSDIPFTDTVYFRNAHPVLFMLLTILPLQFGFLFVPGFIYLKISNNNNWPVLKSKNYRLKIIISITLFISIFLLLPLFTKINEIPLSYFGWFDHLNEIQNEQIAMITNFVQSDINTFIVAVLLISILTGFAEEFFFRGFIFRQMIDNQVNLFVSWGVSGLVFALLHFNYIQFLPLFVFGVVLAMIYTLIGKLWLAIFLHSANNFLQLIWLRIDYSPSWMEDISYEITIPSILLLTGLTIFIFRLLKSNRKSTF